MRSLLTFPNRYYSSWPQKDESADSLQEGTLVDSLDGQHTDDRYFVCYSTPEGWPNYRYRRGSQLALGEQNKEIECWFAAIDVDYPGKVAADEYRDQITAWVRSLRDLPYEPIGRWCAYYQTPGGWRVLYQFDRALDPQQQESVAQYLRDRFADLGVQTDQQCRDWTRLFRMPFALYGDSGKLTSELVSNVSLLVDPDATLMVEATMLQNAGGGPKTSYESHRITGEFADRQAPDIASFLDSVQSKRGTWRRESGCHRVMSASVRAIQSDLNGPNKESHSKHELLKTLKLLNKHEPILEDRNSSINRTALYLANRARSKVNNEAIEPEDVFCFFAPSLAYMDEVPGEICAPPEAGDRGPTWYEHGWAVCCEMASKVNSESAAAAAEKAKRSLEECDEVLEGILGRLTRNNDIDPEFFEGEPDDILAVLQQYAAIKVGNRYHILTSSGRYSTIGVEQSEFYNRVLDAGNPLGLEMSTYNHNSGKNVRRSAKSLSDDYSTAATNVTYRFEDGVQRRTAVSLRTPKSEGDLPEVDITLTAAHWNPDVVDRPRFDPLVHEWLYHLCDRDVEQWLRLQCWLAHFMDLRKYLPALVIAPVSRAGKSLLVQGIEDLFNSTSVTRDLASELGYGTGGRREGGNLQRNNILYKEEESIVDHTIGGINGGSYSRSQLAKRANSMVSRLKRLITSSVVLKKKLYQDEEVQYHGVPRVLIAANHDEDTGVLLQAWNDEADINVQQSMMNRILSIDTGDSAVRWIADLPYNLEDLGWARRDHPRRSDPGFEKWFSGLESAYAVARHIVWLNRYVARGAPINEEDFTDTTRLIPYDEVIPRPEDILLSIKPSKKMLKLIEFGSDGRSRFFDGIVDLTYSCFMKRESKAPVTRLDIETGKAAADSKGVYWAQDIGAFVVAFSTLSSRFDDISDSPKPMRTKISMFKSWGMRPLDFDGVRIRVDWGTDGEDVERIGIDTSGLWVISMETMRSRARAAGNERMLTILERKVTL